MIWKGDRTLGKIDEIAFSDSVIAFILDLRRENSRRERMLTHEEVLSLDELLRPAIALGRSFQPQQQIVVSHASSPLVAAYFRKR